jgi:methylase of polypeptide subunit release factors
MPQNLKLNFNALLFFFLLQNESLRNRKRAKKNKKTEINLQHKTRKHFLLLRRRRRVGLHLLLAVYARCLFRFVSYECKRFQVILFGGIV